MFKYVLFLFIITLGHSQLTNLMKIVSDGKSNALVTDVEKVGNYLYFSVAYDTTINNKVQKKTQILQADLSLNILKRIYLNNSAEKFFTYDIFPLKNPITQETYLGLLYTNIYKDVNYWDSISTVGLGFIDLTTYNFFSTDSFLKNFYNSNLGSIPVNSPKEILVVNDSLILAVFVKKVLDFVNFIQTEQKFIASFGFDGNTFSFKDSITIVHTNNPLSTMYVSLFKLGTTGNPKLFIKNTLGEIKVHQINSVSPLNISLINTLNNNYLPYFNGGSYDHGLFYLLTQNDTLLDFSLLGTNYNVADLYLYKRYNTTFYDSMFITKDSIKLTLGDGRIFVKYASAKYPNAFFVLSKELFNINLMNELSADYDLIAVDSNYFALYSINTNNLKINWSTTLGNEAFYGVCGVYALSDTSCLVYGWRFPLGDLTRTDGDAFVWKISWNSGIVTPLLGKSSEYALTISPNPTSNLLHVRSNKSIAPTFSLFDTQGKLLFGKHFSKNKTFSLDISELPKGVYLLKINNLGHEFVEKIVKE